MSTNIRMASFSGLVLLMANMALGQNSSCDCMETWAYDGTDYNGCDTTPDMAGQDWCYVLGGANCFEAKDSAVAGEGRKWRECAACNCMREWHYQNEIYSGCSPTDDWASDWCYIQGDKSNCVEALDSEVANENRKWRECSPCNCMPQWNYLNGSYSGCSETPDWDGHDWCYVQGDTSNCIHAQDSLLEGEDRKYRECSPCNCMTQWNYNGTNFNGCSATPDWDGHDWCYVEGNVNCIHAKNSEVKDEPRKFRECSPCNCMTQWNYNGTNFNGCSATPDWVGHDWCYVQGNLDDCIHAKNSSVKGEDRKYRECSPCNCMTQWNYKDNLYHGCSETPDWVAHDWCYIEGEANCVQGAKSTVTGEHNYWRECAPCNCMTQWDYQGKTYEGCAETPDWPNTDWCYVQGGPDCGKAEASNVTGEDRRWSKCSIKTCGEVKQLYKSSSCCGNPSKLMQYARRLSANRLYNQGGEFSARIADALQLAETEGLSDDNLARKIHGLIKPYLAGRPL